MKSTRTRKAMAALAATALASVALAGPLQAQPDGPEADAPPVADVDEGFVCDIDLDDFDPAEFEGDFEEWIPTAEELADINADTDALVAMLADNGITIGIETDDYGFTYPAFDDNTDEATWNLVDQYYEDLYGDLEDLEEFEGDLEAWTPTADELADINADTDALIAMLADNGITIGIETDDYGFTYPALDDNTDDTTWNLVDQYYEDLYGDLEDLEDFDGLEGEHVDGELDLDGCDFAEFDMGAWTPTAEELADINAETDALIAMLADNGITIGIETDDYGFTYPAFDDNTDDTTWDLVDQYYQDLYGDLDDLEDFEDHFDGLEGEFDDGEPAPHDVGDEADLDPTEAN